MQYRFCIIHMIIYYFIIEFINKTGDVIMSDINQIKYNIIEEMRKKLDVFYKISNTQYRIRCPFCGDSQKNLKDSHMYLKCDLYDNEPILYNCFRGNCGARGRVNKHFLDKLGIQVNGSESFDNQLFKKIPSIKNTNVDILTGYPDLDSEQVKYICYRLGTGFTVEDYDKFKIVWNIDSLYQYITNIRIKNVLPSNRDSISFLSDDKSALMSRIFDDKLSDTPWRKIKMFPSENKSFYTIKTILDLFTPENITINMGEGIFDALSIYKNFNTGDNSVYIAALGADYESVLVYMIAKGLIGSNVNINVYIDSDIDEKFLVYKLKKYKWIFNSIVIHRNIISKDVGVRIEKIQLKRYEI